MQKNEVNFGSRLKNLREESRYTQSEVAKVLKVTVSTYSGWETGRTRPSKLGLFSDLADLYGCSVDYLLGRTDERRIPRHNSLLPCSGSVFMKAMQRNVEGKRLLAAYVVKYFINPGDLLLLDIGSTLTILATELRGSGIGGLRVASHSISAPLQLMESAIDYIQLGGKLHIAEAAVLPTKEMADNWFPWHGPYKALVTTGSLSIENGAATPDPHVALLVQRYMADADEIIMIADHTKFYSKATATITMCGLAPEKTDWLSEEKKFRLITDVNWDYEVEAEEYRKLVKIIEPLTPTDEEFSSLRIFESVLVPKLQDTKR